jgi:hypothetical protein
VARAVDAQQFSTVTASSPQLSSPALIPTVHFLSDLQAAYNASIESYLEEKRREEERQQSTSIDVPILMSQAESALQGMHRALYEPFKDEQKPQDAPYQTTMEGALHPGTHFISSLQAVYNASIKASEDNKKPKEEPPLGETEDGEQESVDEEEEEEREGGPPAKKKASSSSQPPQEEERGSRRKARYTPTGVDREPSKQRDSEWDLLPRTKRRLQRDLQELFDSERYANDPTPECYVCADSEDLLYLCSNAHITCKKCQYKFKFCKLCRGTAFPEQFLNVLRKEHVKATNITTCPGKRCRKILTSAELVPHMFECKGVAMAPMRIDQSYHITYEIELRNLNSIRDRNSLIFRPVLMPVNNGDYLIAHFEKVNMDWQLHVYFLPHEGSRIVPKVTMQAYATPSIQSATIVSCIPNVYIGSLQMSKSWSYGLTIPTNLITGFLHNGHLDSTKLFACQVIAHKPRPPV